MQGKRAPTIQHLRPVRTGGSHGDSNIQVWCHPCNSGDRVTTTVPKFNKHGTPGRPSYAGYHGGGLIEAAVENFGITTDPQEAGYLLPDGRMLDFSGRHRQVDSRYDPEVAGQRTVDHREIDALTPGKTGTDAIVEFTRETGAARIEVVDGYVGMQVARPLTPTQRRWAVEMAKRYGHPDSPASVNIDRTDDKGRTVASMSEYDPARFAGAFDKLDAEAAAAEARVGKHGTKTRPGYSRLHPGGRDLSAAEKEWESRANEEAYKAGVDVARVREALQDEVAQAVQDAEVRINIGAEDMMTVLADGRFKNQFETGDSGGVYSPRAREEAETDLFGLEQATPAEDRPIYGYLESPSARTMTDGADMYGDIQVVLKDSVMERTTFTVGDSLTLASEGLFGVPLGAIDRYHLAVPARTATKYFNYPDKLHTVLAPGYHEAQIHGGVQLSDIKEVRIRSYRSEADLLWSRDIGAEQAHVMWEGMQEDHGRLKRRLDAAGIPYEEVYR
jgi:hypothetical protein